MLLFSSFSCFAPQIYASADCDRWLAEYKQGLLQKRVERRIAAARHRLQLAAQHRLSNVVFHPHLPTHPHVHRASLPKNAGPLARLKRFALECGDLIPSSPSKVDVATIPTTGLLPPAPPEEVLTLLSLSQPPTTIIPPVVPGTQPPMLSTLPPPSAGTFPPPSVGIFPPTGPGVFPPTGPGVFPPTLPSTPPVVPSPVPEPSSFVLVLTGACAAAIVWRRRTKAESPF